jgi:hypothetical protein
LECETGRPVRRVKEKRLSVDRPDQKINWADLRTLTNTVGLPHRQLLFISPALIKHRESSVTVMGSRVGLRYSSHNNWRVMPLCFSSICICGKPGMTNTGPKLRPLAALVAGEPPIHYRICHRVMANPTPPLLPVARIWR